MTKIHQRIIKELLIENKENAVAILLFGSFSRGEGNENSDVDIEIITEKKKEWELKKSKRYNIEIDLVICPKEHLLMQIEKYPYLCYDYIIDKVLYDSCGFIKEIRQKLNPYFNNHPEVVEFWENKLKIMKKKKKTGKTTKQDAIKVCDEAEILFSKEKKITRDFFLK